MYCTQGCCAGLMGKVYPKLLLTIDGGGVGGSQRGGVGTCSQQKSFSFLHQYLTICKNDIQKRCNSWGATFCALHIRIRCIFCGIQWVLTATIEIQSFQFEFSACNRYSILQFPTVLQNKPFERFRDLNAIALITRLASLRLRIFRKPTISTFRLCKDGKSCNSMVSMKRRRKAWTLRALWHHQDFHANSLQAYG